MPRLAWHLEEPRVGQSYPNFYAAQLASKFVKVVLSGAGGDELFGGYPWRYYRAVVNDDFDGRITRKILSFELRKGLVQQRLTLSPGRHDVRVHVRWDDNSKYARISGVFRPGASRKLDVQVSRIGGKLSLAWK